LLSAKQVAPGMTGEIEVSVKTEGLTVVNKSVTVKTNDPRQSQIVLNLTAAVRKEFLLSAPSVFFGTVAKGTEASREVDITVQGEESLKVVSAESTDKSVTVSLRPVPGNDKKVKLMAVQKADAPSGYHYGVIIVKTTSPRTPELKIPVRGTTAPAVQ
jgi:hypothetical protein